MRQIDMRTEKRSMRVLNIRTLIVKIERQIDMKVSSIRTLTIINERLTSMRVLSIRNQIVMRGEVRSMRREKGIIMMTSIMRGRQNRINIRIEKIIPSPHIMIKSISRTNTLSRNIQTIQNSFHLQNE